MIGASQWGMLVCTPLVEAQQDCSVRVENLPEVVVRRQRFRLAEQRLIPLEAKSHISHTNNCPSAFHRLLLGLNRVGLLEPISFCGKDKRKAHKPSLKEVYDVRFPTIERRRRETRRTGGARRLLSYDPLEQAQLDRCAYL